MCHRIERFECRVGEIWEGESRFEHFRCTGKSGDYIAIFARHAGGRPFRGVLIGGKNFFRPTLLGLALIPVRR